jgi:hypothetical protein
MAHKQCVAANVSGGSRCPVAPHRPAPRGAPRHVLQLRRKQLAVSEAMLIKGADKVLTRLSLFLYVTLSHPRLKQDHQFPALVVTWAVQAPNVQIDAWHRCAVRHTGFHEASKTLLFSSKPCEHRSTPLRSHRGIRLVNPVDRQAMRAPGNRGTRWRPLDDNIP